MIKLTVFPILMLLTLSCGIEPETTAQDTSELSPADQLDSDVCDLFRTAKPIAVSPTASTTGTLSSLAQGKVYAIQTTSASGGYLSFDAPVHSHYLAYAAEPVAQLLISVFDMNGVNIPAEFISAVIPECDLAKQRALIELPKGEFRVRFKSGSGKTINVVLIDGGVAYNHSESDGHAK